MTAGTCRFCSCQERTPCPGGCAWTDDTRTLCTTCLGAAALLQSLIPALGIVAAKPKHQIHQAAGSWDALDLESQRVLVKACRTWLDEIQHTVAAELGERALENGEELDAIAAFLLERCPEEFQRSPDEPLAAIVVRLLEPHVGKRVVLAGGR